MVKDTYTKRTPYRCANCVNAIGKDHLTCIERNRPVNHWGWCDKGERKS